MGDAVKRTVPTLAMVAWLTGCSASGGVQQGPSDTLRAYAQALEQNRVDDAYRLLSAEAKSNMSLEAFRRAVKENPEDALEIARSIARPSSDPVVTATVSIPSGEELLLVYEGGRWRIDNSAVDLYSQSTPRQALLGFLRAYDRKRYDVILRYVPDAEKEGPAPVESREPPAQPAPPAGSAAPPADKSAPPASPATPRAPLDKAPPADGADKLGRLTAEKLRAAWEGQQKEQMSRIVQAIKSALPTAAIEEAGDSASMAYGAGGTVAFTREHGVWKIKDFQ
jgi:hypothetical protein